MKSHVLLKDRGSQSSTGLEVPFLWCSGTGWPRHTLGIGCGMACRLTSNLESSSYHHGPYQLSPLPTDRSTAPYRVGEGRWVGRGGTWTHRERALGPFATEVSGHQRPQIGVERPDKHGDQIRWGRPLHGLDPAPSQVHGGRDRVWQPSPQTQDDPTELCSGVL